MTHVIQKEQDSKEIAEDERIVNFARGPPVYDGSDSNFITKIKEDLGIQVDRYGFEEFFKDIFNPCFNSQYYYICRGDY